MLVSYENKFAKIFSFENCVLCLPPFDDACLWKVLKYFP